MICAHTHHPHHISIQPSDEATSFGPLISALQRDKVIDYIEGAKTAGAKVVTGGQKWAQSTGFYVEPTVVTGVTPEMKCVQEEVSCGVLNSSLLCD